MKTLVIKNFCPIGEWGYTEVILNFRNFDSIEKVPTREASDKYRVTLLTERIDYDLQGLSETEANRLTQRLLDFSRAETQCETLVITINPDKLTIEET